MSPFGKSVAAVAVGSGAGGVLRLWAVVWASALFPASPLVGLVLVNVVGSFAIGLGATVLSEAGRFRVSPEIRLFFLAGVCGGLTTFSFFSLYSMLLLEDGRVGAAFVFGVSTLGLSLLAVAAGWAGGIKWNRATRVLGA
ncbi:MAG: CrcB family protein [Opitutales bacterium]|nr:CrcB family protein [Opitutales bacterium]